MTKVVGIDFTSAPSRRKPMTMAECDLVDGDLRVLNLRQLTDFRQFEDVLVSPDPWTAGIDFPFGQPRELVAALGWPTEWAGYVAHVAALGKAGFVNAIRNYQLGRSTGQKEHLRVTDRIAKSRSPMKLYFQPVG